MNNEKSNTRNSLAEKCFILAETILAIQPVYKKANPIQKAFLETMIGAAIWYIPKPQSAWTGKITKGALKVFHPESGIAKPRFSEEHVYPRKVTARLLLNDPSLDGANLLKMFSEKYGRLHLMTSDENKSVQQYQRVDIFTTPENAYLQAGIEFVEIKTKDLQQIKKRDSQTIEKYLRISNEKNI